MADERDYHALLQSSAKRALGRELLRKFIMPSISAIEANAPVDVWHVFVGKEKRVVLNERRIPANFVFHAVRVLSSKPVRVQLELAMQCPVTLDLQPWTWTWVSNGAPAASPGFSPLTLSVDGEGAVTGDNEFTVIQFAGLLWPKDVFNGVTVAHAVARDEDHGGAPLWNFVTYRDGCVGCRYDKFDGVPWFKEMWLHKYSHKSAFLVTPLRPPLNAAAPSLSLRQYPEYWSWFTAAGWVFSQENSPRVGFRVADPTSLEETADDIIRWLVHPVQQKEVTSMKVVDVVERPLTGRDVDGQSTTQLFDITNEVVVPNVRRGDDIGLSVGCGSLSSITLDPPCAYAGLWLSWKKSEPTDEPDADACVLTVTEMKDLAGAMEVSYVGPLLKSTGMPYVEEASGRRLPNLARVDAARLVHVPENQSFTVTARVSSLLRVASPRPLVPVFADDAEAHIPG